VPRLNKKTGRFHGVKIDGVNKKAQNTQNEKKAISMSGCWRGGGGGFVSKGAVFAVWYGDDGGGSG